jgi:CRP-like cAMP-binding protein
MITKNYKENMSFIEDNQFFKYLTPNQKDKLASIAINQKFEKNSDICKQGELASSMYILKSGKLARFKGADLQGIINPGESFEEHASLTKGCVRR